MENENPSQQVVLQRIRNRILEYLEIAASFQLQRDYQKTVPFVSVPNEMINAFEDWPRLESEIDNWGPPVFSQEEISTLRLFYKTWDTVASETPDPLPQLEVTLEMPAWEKLRLAAEETHKVFMIRGKLSDNYEI